MATYGEIAAHSAYDMFSWHKYLNVNLVFFFNFFPTSVFGVGIFFLNAPFPDPCLLAYLYLSVVVLIVLCVGVYFYYYYFFFFFFFFFFFLLLAP